MLNLKSKKQMYLCQPSEKVSVSITSNMVSRLNEILKKPRFTVADLAELRQLRDVARILSQAKQLD